MLAIDYILFYINIYSLETCLEEHANTKRAAAMILYDSTAEDFYLLIFADTFNFSK